jgi:hypothetical protein
VQVLSENRTFQGQRNADRQSLHCVFHLIR